jgi:P-type E1-E2 ATPase
VQHVVLDYNGTLSFDGELIGGVKEALTTLSQSLTVHVLTGDTFGTAKAKLAAVPCTIRILGSPGIDEEKAVYINQLGAEGVVAYGNGLNDRRMLKAARLGIVVMGREGCAVETLLAADICISDIVDGLDLLLNPKRLEATLKL